MTAVPAKTLDELGRCCGRKPLVYKRPKHYLFCCRCNAQFTPEGDQDTNWAFSSTGDGAFTPTYPKSSNA